MAAAMLAHILIVEPLRVWRIAARARAPTQEGARRGSDRSHNSTPDDGARDAERRARSCASPQRACPARDHDRRKNPSSSAVVGAIAALPTAALTATIAARRSPSTSTSPWRRATAQTSTTAHAAAHVPPCRAARRWDLEYGAPGKRNSGLSH
eukprot:gene33797-12677_t